MSQRPGRLVVVSNRLPFTITTLDKELRFSESAGGLVSGLSSYLQSLASMANSPREHLWVGWPGATIPQEMQARVEEQARSRFYALPIFFNQKEMDEFYFGFCNKTIWPLFHYFPSYTSYSAETWDQYRTVNERFAEALSAVLRPGDRIWIHDYHLMLLPSLLRARLPEASIGFFLHIPFPSFEIFRLLPGKWRREILEGILGADLVGFHTYDYTQHFLQCVLRILDRDHNLGLIRLPTHVVTVQTFPMGIDYEGFQETAHQEAVVQESKALKKALHGSRIILSVDRLDYTKGILNRLRAFEHLLHRHPQYHGNVVLVVVVVPSRVMVDQYETMKRQIEEMISRINGKYGNIHWTPIIYQYRYLPMDRLVALYNASEVALVTPLRDGMNLVAKEYLACRVDKTGVLILSEMAGAAKELGEAVIINPNDTEEVADAMHEALEMPRGEQKRRNLIMQSRLRRYNVHRWAEDFISQLQFMEPVQDQYLVKLLSEEPRASLVESFVRSKRRLLLLDYDGTLVPLAKRPALARPTESVLRLLAKLAESEKNTVVLVSGRDKETLNEWFGSLPIHLVAENDMWRKSSGSAWQLAAAPSMDWKVRLLPILQQYADRLPGSFVEMKDFSVAWHYRTADPEQSQDLVGEVSDHLTSFTANIDVQVLHGSKVLEIKTTSTNKGTAARHWIADGGYDFMLSIGDDWTDEDIFGVLPDTAFTIKIGLTSTRARFTMRDNREAVALLNTLAKNGFTGVRAERPEQMSAGEATPGPSVS
ncbi:bifunctional alpha,alpha-trehalose-phosphate synthase (UDP-forming)/trehalose-phosphatase [bacterium]|nr:MAG: bifunctional alpha,alpha-trehalose-phosphate synthase (UDP-forming)/trehalose-phosphatase [bacterium]